MFHTYCKLAAAVIAALLLLAAFMGCSDAENRISSPEEKITVNEHAGDNSPPEEVDHQEAVAFQNALEKGKYRFSVDEKGNLIPLNGSTIPACEQELFQEFLRLSDYKYSKKTIDDQISLSALSDYWRYACWREICYALSRTKYLQGNFGQSTRHYYWNRAWWIVGDWNYDGLGYGRGGNCKYFANRILKRATGNRYSLPAGYYYAHGDISYCKPGDIIQRPTCYGTPHTAIVFTVLSRNGAGHATKIDVIDANYIAGMGNGMIARHYFPYGSHKLYQYRVW